MKNSDTKNELRKYLDELEIIDAHEHFTPEEYHITTEYNFFYWMMPYVQFDLVNAGMDRKYLWNPPKGEKETDECFNEFIKVWKYVKHGTYARAFLKAIKEFYGMEDITRENYRLLGEKMNETRYEGRYREILSERCKIKCILNQTGAFSYKDEYLTGSYQAINKVNGNDIESFINQHPHCTLDDYIDSIAEEMKKAAAEGAVLAKYDTTSFITEIDRDTAVKQFEEIRKNGEKSFVYPCILSSYIFDRLLDATKDAGLVAAVHTGVWFDVTKKNPEILFPVIERHPDVMFDVYHMGMPYVRECAFLGKNYPNVYLNLCWSFIVSEKMARSALDEWIDLVPVNKIIGFGGDYATMPENIWAHLEFAKECLSDLFAERVENEEMTMDDAKTILNLWLYENPKRLYNLDIK